MAIRTDEILGASVSDRWAVPAPEYAMQVDGKPVKVDFQDLAVYITEQRALGIEAEVGPLSTRIRRNNDWLDKLGQALSQLSSLSAKYDTSDKANPSVSFTPDATFVAVANRLALPPMGVNWTTATIEKMYKADADEATQRIKTETDRVNNENQLAMSRLQSIVTYRDQTFNTASTLMSSVSDTRGNTIRSMM